MQAQAVRNANETIIDTYLRDIGRYPLLTAADEIELARRARDGDANALDHLINANLRFVVTVAKKYANLGLPMEDLINEGNIGLIKAAQRFDPDRGFKFVSYAVWWIRQSILQALTTSTRTIRLPANRAAVVQRVNKVAREFLRENGRKASSEEIADLMDISMKDIEEALRVSTPIVSLDEPVSSGQEGYTTGDYIVDERAVLPDEAFFSASLPDDVERAITTLPEREQLILRKYYGLDGEEALTLEKIGELLGRTRERVRQLKEQAIEKLRQGAYLDAHRRN